MKKTLFCMGCAIGFGLGLVMGPVPSFAASGYVLHAAASSLVSPVAEQQPKEKKKPSDRTVRVIMGWAFAAVPETVKRGGKDVKLDRTNPKDFYIPIEDARRVIRVSMRSANADLCDLKEMEGRNFLKLMSNEKALKKWTPNQMTFIQQLHIATGLVITGSGKAGDEAEKKDDGSADARNKYKCSAEERERIRAAVEAYIK